VPDRPWWADFSHEFVEEYAPPMDDPYWGCLDCGFNTHDEYYVVNADAWPLALDGGKLCVECIEKRLGRRLVPADFLPCPANDLEWRKTPRLLERMREDG
jgi:hypothetical protein